VDLAAPGVNIYSCAPARKTLWADNFDDGSISNWTSGGPNNSWGLTGLESFNIPYSLTDSPNGDYSQHTNSWIRTPELDISGARNSRFEFKIKGRSEPGYDRLFVETSTDGAVWTAIAVKISGVGVLFGVSGTISEWTDAYADLSVYDGFSTLYVRFSLITDWTNNYDGWYIDDVAVTAASDSYDGSEYRFLSGTSMAAPHVAGAAALIKALNPDLSAAAVKSTLMATVDIKTGLSTLLASSGRLNAFEAVNAPDSGSLQFEAAAYSISENDSSVTLMVTRSGGGDGQVSIDYEAAGGTATEGVDFTELAGSLSWGDGDMGSRTFSVGIRDDTEHENSETVEIVLKAPTGGSVIGHPSRAVLTIIDNDSPGSLEISNFWLLMLPSILNSN
jgi:subtilisin family serine protease